LQQPRSIRYRWIRVKVFSEFGEGNLGKVAQLLPESHKDPSFITLAKQFETIAHMLTDPHVDLACPKNRPKGLTLWLSIKPESPSIRGFGAWVRIKGK
jgi:hypothetical protein